MHQPHPEAIENRPRGGTCEIKEDVEIRAAVEDILNGNADIPLRDLSVELRSRLPKKPCIGELRLSRFFLHAKGAGSGPLRRE